MWLLLLLISCNEFDPSAGVQPQSFSHNSSSSFEVPESWVTGYLNLKMKGKTIEEQVELSETLAENLHIRGTITPKQISEEKRHKTKGPIKGGNGCELSFGIADNGTDCGFPMTVPITFISIDNGQMMSSSLTFDGPFAESEIIVPERHVVRVDVFDMDCSGSFKLVRRNGNPWNFTLNHVDHNGNFEISPENFYYLVFPRHWPYNPHPIIFGFLTYLCQDWCTETINFRMELRENDLENPSTQIRTTVIPDQSTNLHSFGYRIFRRESLVANGLEERSYSAEVAPLKEGFSYAIRNLELNFNHPVWEVAPVDLEVNLNEEVHYAYINKVITEPLITPNFDLLHNGVYCSPRYSEGTCNASINLLEKHCGPGSLHQLEVLTNGSFDRVDWSSDSDQLQISIKSTEEGRNFITVRGPKPAYYPVTVTLYLEDGCLVSQTVEVYFGNTYDTCD